MEIKPKDPFFTAHGLTHIVGTDERTYIEATDGERYFGIAHINQAGQYDMRVNPEDYPDDAKAAVLSMPGKRQGLVLSPEDFKRLWQALGDMTVSLGYDRTLTGGAFILYHEGYVQRQVHRDRYTYTVEDCLRLMTRFRPRFTYTQIGILIDRNIPVETLLGIPQEFPYDYINLLYPTLMPLQG